MLQKVIFNFTELLEKGLLSKVNLAVASRGLNHVALPTNISTTPQSIIRELLR